MSNGVSDQGGLEQRGGWVAMETDVYVAAEAKVESVIRRAISSFLSSSTLKLTAVRRKINRCGG